MDYPPKKLIHELFEEQVERTPDDTAVVHGKERLSYVELNRQANRLAHYLCALGVRPDDRVALCLERGIEMIVGMLGVLKAGAAYVPIDPAYPAERRALMLSDSAPVVSLTQSFIEQAGPHTTQPRIPVVSLDIELYQAGSNLAGQPVHNPDPVSLGLCSRNLAYVIYTSGSTGTPKGVQVEHHSLRNLVNWYVGEIPIAPGDAVLIVTSYGFDITQKNVFGPLQVGAVVVLAPEPFDARAILSLVRQERITHLNLTPSAFYVLLDADDDDDLRSVRRLMLGGETIQVARLRQLHEPRPQIFNFYGPTECTILCAYHRLTADLDTYSHRPVPIGKPVRNMRLYVLDAQGSLVPPGVIGEIHIAGDGIARGYRSRPALTAERFLPDPYGQGSGRMYKTGDLGRYRTDGEVEYLGRNDHQVKIRGFRIELGEIEAHLSRHERVKDVVVVAREDGEAQKRLVAYVVPKDRSEGAAELGSGELRSRLQAVLPDYMVPTAFVILTRLPLTQNGKLDRDALPAPGFDASAGPRREPPEGEIEVALAGIWQDILQVPRVARGDDFFELGGHSLLIVQMNERLRRLGLSVAAHSVYHNPTLACLAKTLGRDRSTHGEVPPNLIRPGCQTLTPEMLPLVRLTAQQIDRIVHRVPGGASNVQDIYPLAPLQEGILFHHLLNEQGDTYVVSTLIECQSRADLNALILALQGVIDRHDVLRSAIFWEQLPRPVQVVCRRAPLSVEELKLDCARNPFQQLEEQMAPRQQSFDLREAPIMRLQIAADARGPQWYAVLKLHHMASDHVAREFLLAEITAHLRGHASQLPQSAPYRNHVAQALAAVRPADAERFFRRKLGDVDEPTAPFGLLDVYGDGTDIEVESQTVEESLARRVHVHVRQLRVSAATLFHAAWALVVARTSGRDDVVFGTVLSGRLQGRDASKRILGMFINTLPLRLKLDVLSVVGLVEHTHRELAELLEYEQVPLAEANRCSGIPGSAPLFSTLLNYVHDGPESASEQLDPAGRIRVLANREWTNYPITVSVSNRDGQFLLTAAAHRQVGPVRVLGYLHTALRGLLEALSRAPRTPALSVSIVAEAERRHIVESFNATRRQWPPASIHELFEAQVARAPAAIAVSCDDQQLSYAELNGRANQLARYLMARGVGPETLVGICLPRTPEMIVTLLGVLKAGGGYLPLDPRYPPGRLKYLLADAAPRVLVTDERLKDVLPETAAQVVSLDAEWPGILAEEASNLDPAVTGVRPHHVAYVIYTSGSTGQPKGVVIEHRNTVNFLEWARHALAPELFEQTLFSTSLSFDLSVYECFAPLTVGARVALVTSVLDLHHQAVRPTLINTVPSAVQALLEAKAIPASTRSIHLGGEALDQSLAERIFAQTPVDSLCNLYGPTETTTYSTWLRMDRAAGFCPGIGRPIANTRIYVLDDQMCPLPVGVAGEIYIGGAGVTRGYLNRPRLTAQRFLPDPFTTDPHGRLYRTGDLGRWREDGILEFLGRNDGQMKFRGFRIEPAEIEAQLLSHGRIGHAAVALRQDVTGEWRLVAYVVQREQGGAGAQELRDYLKARLPEHMVPSAYVALESLPLTPNGKLDRAALPAPDFEASHRNGREPQGETEETLAAIWRDILRVGHVGRDDNCFDLGGQSLLLMKLVVRVADTFDVHLPIHVAFRRPVLRDMARTIEMLIAQQREPAPVDERQFEEGVL